jgi:hypothetical protein
MKLALVVRVASLAFVLAPAPLAARGCDDGAGAARAARAPRPDEIPETIAVSATTMTSGFAIAKLRQPRAVGAFRIARYPVTVARYRSCVDAGACAPPARRDGACASAAGAPTLAGPTWDVGGGEALPLTCALPEQARAYCAWVGGALPDSDQWQLAARGPNVHRFAWGDADPMCDLAGAAPTNPFCCATDECKSVAKLGVGARAFAASPLGMEDVLATPAELLRANLASDIPACAASDGYCAVKGQKARAIDSVAPMPRAIDADAAAPPSVFGFRCVFGGER